MQGKSGAFYNLFRRNVVDEPSPIVAKRTVDQSCQLIGIDRPTREAGLRLLVEARRSISSGRAATFRCSVPLPGRCSRATADAFDELGPTAEEHAILNLSERVSEKPIVALKQNGSSPTLAD